MVRARRRAVRLVIAADEGKIMIGVVEHGRKVAPGTSRELHAAVAAAGLNPVAWLVVRKAKKARRAVADLVAAGADPVIVCGGDGTVRAAAEALVDTGVALAVLPTGTANLFAAGLGLSSDPAAVVRAAVSGRRRVLDTGECNERTFVVMAGIGFDAGMIDRADEATGLLGKERLGSLSYVWAGVTEAHDRESFAATVTVDGQPFFDGQVTCVLLANLGELQGGLRAFPDASPADGRLDVGIVTAEGLRQWATLMLSAARGRQASSPHAELCQGREIDVRLEREHRIELDGGTKGSSDHLRVRVRPGSLVVCEPP